MLDVKMEGLSGLGLQPRIAHRGGGLFRAIFITGPWRLTECRVPSQMKAGAVEFSPSLFAKQELVDARANKHVALGQLALRHRLNTDALQHSVSTIRELTSLARKKSCRSVAQGLLNKQVALKLSASEGTIKSHRGHVHAEDASLDR